MDSNFCVEGGEKRTFFVGTERALMMCRPHGRLFLGGANHALSTVYALWLAARVVGNKKKKISDSKRFRGGNDDVAPAMSASSADERQQL